MRPAAPEPGGVGAFQPPPSLANRHLQTLWSPLFRRPPLPPRRRRQLELADGDYLLCDWSEPPVAAPELPTVILLHGLAGCSGSPYILGMQQVLLARGWRSVVLNFRGSTGTPNRLARSYHSGDTADLDALYREVRRRLPCSPMAAIGYSLGGNVLLRWLGERGGIAALRAAVAVSVPLRLDLCASRLDQGFSRLYRDHLLRRLKRGLEAKRQQFARQGNSEQLALLDALGDWRGARSFWEFDHRVVAPLHGFRDAADYYARCSSRGVLDRIALPTLIIQAVDDPFVPPAALPAADELAPAVTLQVTARGGHVGFVDGSPRRPGYWLERAVPAFLEAHWQADGQQRPRPGRPSVDHGKN